MSVRDEIIYVYIDMDAINSEVEEVAVYENLVDWGRPFNEGDEGKVVSDGALIAQTAKSVTENGTYDTTTNNSVQVNVEMEADLEVRTFRENGVYLPSAGKDGISKVTVNVDEGYPEPTGTITITENGLTDVKDYEDANVNVPNSYTAADEGKVVSSGALVAQTSTTKTSNGTYDTTTNDEVVIDVPNTYAASDEGKVVSSGALVAQTSTTVTQNGTYDTTENDEVVVNVSGGGSAVVQALSVTQNGTYTPPSGVDGYAPVTVSVSGGGGSDFDLSYLPNSDSTKVLCSYPSQPPTGATIGNDLIYRTALDSDSSDSTIYMASKRNSGTGEVFIMSRPGTKYPFFNNKTSSVEYAIYNGGNTAIPNILPTDLHVYAMAVNATTKAVRYFCDGVYLGEKTATSINATVVFNGRSTTHRDTTGSGDITMPYIGVVEECESDATVISNMQTIMQKLGIGA